MLPSLKNMVIGGAAIAGAAGVVNHVAVDKPTEAVQQAYFQDDPSAATATYGGVLPGQRPLIREISSEDPVVAMAAPAPQPMDDGRRVARPSARVQSAGAEAPRYGGIGNVPSALVSANPPPNPLANELPNLSTLAPAGIGAGGLTGIPELDEVMRRGSVGVPQMIDALRQSHARVQSLSPGNTSSYLLACLSALSDDRCAPMRREVDVLHAEMMRIAAEAMR